MDWVTKPSTAITGDPQSVPNLLHDPYKGPIKRVSRVDFPVNYPAPQRCVTTSMAKPSLYRVDQTQHAVITDTTGPTEMSKSRDRRILQS